MLSNFDQDKEDFNLDILNKNDANMMHKLNLPSTTTKENYLADYQIDIKEVPIIGKLTYT